MIAITLSDGSEIDATDHHPFWDETTGSFVDAIDLAVDDRVVSDNGRRLTVKAARIYDRSLVAYNLEIDDIHTYYAGTTPVLVHNTCGSLPARRGAFNEAKRRIGIPRSQQPTSVGPALDRAGNKIPGSRVYRFGRGPNAPFITNHPPTRYPDGGYQPGHFHPNAPGDDPHIYYGN